MDKVLIENKQSQAVIKLLGAEIISWNINGQDVVHNGQTFWTKHAPILFPFIGKSKDKNKPKHGFVKDLVFKIQKQQKQLVILETELKDYWFDCLFVVKYELKGNKLIVEFSIINKENKKVEFKIGWHPAFKLYGNIDNYKLSKSQESYLLNKNGNITGQKETITNKLNSQIFQKLDTIIYDQIDKLKLSNQNHHVIISSNLPVMGIWQPPNADFLCLEPWSNFPEHEDEKLDKWSTIEAKEIKKYNIEVEIKWL